MAWVRVQKNRSYFRRFQVAFRRRREGKTDYQARKNLIMQDKNKYAAPRYRLVVRQTNKDVICQIVAAGLTHDRVLCAAYAHELPQFGLKAGLTNYPACYCTGLLCGRRLLQKLSHGSGETPMATLYKGLEKCTGEEYHVDDEDERRAFKACLDLGLSRSSTGANVFAAMKGCVDAGINIPHSMKRFPGYTKDKFDSAVLRKRLLGDHISQYMAMLKDEDEEAYKRQFSSYVKAGVTPDQLAPMYEKVHAAIRANPCPEKPKREVKPYERKNQPKLDLATRKANLQAKKLALLQKLMAN